MLNHPSSKSNITHTDKGIVPTTEEKYSFHKKRVENKLRMKGFSSSSLILHDKMIHICSSFIIEQGSLIGGISGDDPFKTTYHSLTEGSFINNQVESSRSLKEVSISELTNKHNKDGGSQIKKPVAPLTRYSNSHILGKSLLSNIGASLVTNDN